ncbi:MAG TPA: hypothetical protein VMV86_05315, partial [Methanosarcinales archaeon]|nr:hypothetical protein [Methanosarcinales archaeon]
MKVEVEGIGVLEFPDNTNPDVIDKTVKGLIPKKKEEELGFMRKYLPSIPGTYDVFEKEWRSGKESMSTALKEPTGRNIVSGFLGALQYSFSPLTAIGRGLVGTPTENVLKEVGVPDPAAKFVGDMAETATYFVPYGKAVQSAIVGKEALQQTKQMESIAKTISKQKQALKFPPKLPESAIKDATESISLANKKILKENVIDDVIKELKAPISEKWVPTETKRITQEIVDWISQNPDDITKVANKYNLTPQQLAAQMKETMTLAGRDLGKMGKLAKEIKAKFNTPYMKQLSQYMEKEIADV